MDLTPSNLDVTDSNMAKAKEILNSGKIIIRYLRKEPTVGWATVRPRDDNGKIIDDPDVPSITKRVICHGVPTGVMVAFVDDGKLRIGWSKRNAEKKMVDTLDLHLLFSSIMNDYRDVEMNPQTADAKYQYESAFKGFCQQLVHAFSYSETKDVEIAFRKDTGKEAAILRGMLDSITVYKHFMKSEASGALPNDIARALKVFIPQARQAFNRVPVNINYETKAVVPAITQAVAAV